MKKLFKLLSIVLTLVMVFAYMPITSKAKAFSSDYAQDEVIKLQAFLNQDSMNSGKTNGQMISPSYQADDPTTWVGVKWTDTIPKHVKTIGESYAWYGLQLSGSLDLGGFTQLEYLYCNSNNINAVNVSGASSLEYLYCSNNEISSLDISGANNLLEIECNYNKLTSLNIGDLNKLNKLACTENKLSSLNINSNHALAQLDCDDNNLNSLIIAGDDSLISLDCSNNSLVSLIATSPNMERIICNNNQLETLDISANAKLEVLDCSYNKLNTLDISNNPYIYRLNCSYNNLSSLNFSNNVGMNKLYCDHNLITSIDLSQLYELSEFNCSYNHFTTFYYSRYGAEIQLNASGKGYVGLGFYYNDSEFRSFIATAEPQPGNQLLHWSDIEGISSEVRTLDNETDYNITAVFTDESISPIPSGPPEISVSPGPSVSPEPSVSSTPSVPPISPYPEEPTLTPTLTPAPTPTLTPIPTIILPPAPSPTLTPTPTPIPITHKVTFDLNNGVRTGGGELLQTVADGGAATAPSVERSGYTFKSWDKAFDKVTQDLIVTAIWEKEPEVTKYNVDYDPNGGEGNVPTDDTKYLKGDTATLADGSDLSKEGYQFVGWSYKPDGKVLKDTEILIDGNVTLYAVWKEEEPTPKPEADDDTKSVPKTGDVSTAYSGIVMICFGAAAVINDAIRKRKLK